MPNNRGRRNRRQRQRERGESDVEAVQQPSASNASERGQRQRERRRPASRRRGQSQLNTTKLLIGGTAAGLVILFVVAFAFVFTGGGAAADFSFDVYQGEEELGGANVNFSSLIGNGEPVVLNFWAGNCPPCRAEMPAMQATWDEHKDALTFVGLDVGIFTGLGTRQQGLDLLEELNITYPAGAPPDGKAVRNYNVRSMPTTVFFGADGEVFRRWDGAISESQMNSIVNDMLAAASASTPSSG